MRVSPPAQGCCLCCAAGPVPTFSTYAPEYTGVHEQVYAGVLYGRGLNFFAPERQINSYPIRSTRFTSCAVRTYVAGDERKNCYCCSFPLHVIICIIIICFVFCTDPVHAQKYCAIVPFLISLPQKTLTVRPQCA
jgi:hypothetical protein